MNKTPTTLIIMDGFGIAPPADDNAVTLAKTPVLDKLFQEYAHTTLSASGLDVGLPAGQMGNSGRPPQHRRRPRGVSGPAPHQPRYRGRQLL